jgi:hypothetical protein
VPNIQFYLHENCHIFSKFLSIFPRIFHFCIFGKFFGKRKKGISFLGRFARVGPNRSTGQPALLSSPHATARWTPVPSRSHASATSPLSGRARQPYPHASLPVYPWSRNPRVSHPFPLLLHSPPAGALASATTPVPQFSPVPPLLWPRSHRRRDSHPRCNTDF